LLTIYHFKPICGMQLLRYVICNVAPIGGSPHSVFRQNGKVSDKLRAAD